ncbi:MAG: Crp/Fnr family transcriptional regulator [Bacteroidota bacterium]
MSTWQSQHNKPIPIQDSGEIDELFQVFFSFIRQLVDISPEDQALCRTYFTPVFVKKGSLLESAGSIHNFHNFIVSGYMRNFHYDAAGKEVTTDLNDGPRFFTSYSSFINRTASNESLHCLSDCKLLRITREDNEEITQAGKDSQLYLQKILQHQLETSRQRILDVNTLTAKERYLKLVQNQPAIIEHVPINYIASYLGINPGSLSRIRQEISG